MFAPDKGKIWNQFTKALLDAPEIKIKLNILAEWTINTFCGTDKLGITVNKF